MSPAPLECNSCIDRVAVFARGAVVTRRVTLPASLPSEPFELRVTGITPSAREGTFRAQVDGDREVIGIRSRLVVPSGPAQQGDKTARVRTLELESEALDREQAHLSHRRQILSALSIDPQLRVRWRRQDCRRRVADSLGAEALVDELVAELDRRIGKLDERRASMARELGAARLEASQASSVELQGAGHPTFHVLMQIAAGSGDVRSMELQYAIELARWWPAYRVWVARGESEARICLDAWVAQISGEDWTAVHCSLSTADLVQDTRLPELPSLRLGRAQPARTKGYRAAPEGLDAMFAGHDRASVQLLPPLSGRPTPVARPAAPVRAEAAVKSFPPPADTGAVGMEAAPIYELTPPRHDEAAFAMPPLMQARRAKLADRQAAGAQDGASGATAVGHAGGAASATIGWAHAGAASLEPADAWLDFDSLILDEAEERASRGRLRRKIESAPRGVASPLALDRVEPPKFAHDPRESRGRFDHRYDAETRLDVPSDTSLRRIGIATTTVRTSARLRCVPRESTAVYRELALDNPFAGPMLCGPVEVFYDGALMTTEQLATVDRGGKLWLGLGIEERIKVARNARVQESSAGLLGGSTTIDHHVEIDLSSSLGHAADVQVVDRIPVTDSREVEVLLRSAHPQADPYDQSERQHPVRGGLRWLVALGPGAATRLEYRYRVILSSKHEVVGGNRRE